MTAPAVVAVTGASGFLGSALTRSFQRDGIRVVRLVRRAARTADEVAWDPSTGSVDAPRLEGVDAVVHLAAESIVGIWTPAKRRRILESRERGTRLLASAVAGLDRPPGVLVSASGINYYGHRGEDILTEREPPGSGFVSRVCTRWEEATLPAAAADVRVVCCRFGLVIHQSGGALRVMLPAFRLGLGARLGSGRQWFSWVALEDALRAIRFALEHDSLAGPLNVTSPEPVRNGDFTRAVARSVGRPAFLAVPAFLLRAATGGMAEALLLSSTRGIPQRLTDAGFTFACPSIDRALERGLDGNA